MADILHLLVYFGYVVISIQFINSVLLPIKRKLMNSHKLKTQKITRVPVSHISSELTSFLADKTQSVTLHFTNSGVYFVKKE